MLTTISLIISIITLVYVMIFILTNILKQKYKHSGIIVILCLIMVIIETMMEGSIIGWVFASTVWLFMFLGYWGDEYDEM